MRQQDRPLRRCSIVRTFGLTLTQSPWDHRAAQLCFPHNNRAAQNQFAQQLETDHCLFLDECLYQNKAQSVSFDGESVCCVFAWSFYDGGGGCFERHRNRPAVIRRVFVH